ncbi:MAG: right-handed parallel beta-helix repeat-containing protein [Candidatus Thorarchaeota archaeon]|nr:right-handed parallel beta-helix repeat-containing protein [Candidatus Thorarchaeota archaeon]
MNQRRMLPPVIAVFITLSFCGILVQQMCSLQPCNSANSNIGQRFSPAFMAAAPIEILSNSDFVSQGWPGVGTMENPYRIEGLLITSQINGACIRILNTDRFFKISNCILNPETPGNDAIFFQGIVSGVVDNCAIGQADHGIWVLQSDIVNITRTNLDGSGIVVDTAGGVVVSECSVQNSPGDGITLVQASYGLIEKTFITSSAANGVAVELFSDYNCILNNDIRLNTDAQISIDSESSENVIFGNNLWAGGQCALDNGNLNGWDDGVSLGNAYSDYGGSGPYTISGTAGSVDHYPTLASTTHSTTSTSTSSTTALENRTFSLTLTQPLPLEMRYALAAAYISASFMIAVVILFMVWRSKKS